MFHSPRPLQNSPREGGISPLGWLLCLSTECCVHCCVCVSMCVCVCVCMRACVCDGCCVSAEGAVCVRVRVWAQTLQY